MRHGETRHTTATPDQRISGYVKVLNRRKQGLEHIDLLYHTQRRLSPLQVEESSRLVEDRSYLEALAPQSMHDCYWVVRAWSASEGEGWLLYDESGICRTFFTIEEAVTLLYTFLQAANDLLSRCQPDYLALHVPGVALLRAHLWAWHLERMRQPFESSQPRQGSGSGDQEQPPNTKETREESGLEEAGE